MKHETIDLNTEAVRALVERIALAIDPEAVLADWPEALLFQVEMARAVIREAAEACGMSEGYIRGAIRRKELPRVKHGSAVRIDVEDLKQWNNAAKIEVSVEAHGQSWVQYTYPNLMVDSTGYKR